MFSKPQMSSLNSGFIVAVFNDKGYGFIRREKGRDLIFSVTDIENFDILNGYLEVNQRVTFIVNSNKKGGRATNIKLLSKNI